MCCARYRTPDYESCKTSGSELVFNNQCQSIRTLTNRASDVGVAGETGLALAHGTVVSSVADGTGSTRATVCGARWHTQPVHTGVRTTAVRV